MKKLFLLLLGAGLMAGLIQGCGSKKETSRYTGDAYGVSFSIPAGWELVEEKERQTVLTLQLQDRNRDSSFITVTVFPAELFTGDEAVEQAEKMLRQGLYAMEEPVQRSEMFLASGEPLPLLTARAGQREIIEARTAVLTGGQFHALVTLTARLEHLDVNKTEFQVFLDSMKLE